MRPPTNYDAFQVLLLQLQGDGRDDLLLGESAARVRSAIEPFLVGEKLPNAYLEFPLIGDPFLDVTILYSELAPSTHVESPAAGNTEALFNWFAEAHRDHDDISFGFELDTKEPQLPRAAVHFQPRAHIELAEPFCAIVGEPDRARTYLDMARRMPQGWPLSFFGMFRGRPGSPLRVCGYLDPSEQANCAHDPLQVAAALDEVGFSAYDDKLLNEASELMAACPGTVDFQFDVYPDGHVGDTFALDVQFNIEQPEAVQASFDNGPGSHVTKLLERWGIADKRWRDAINATFARALPVQLEDGAIGRYSFTLMPQWVKVRWRKGVLQPAKLYFLANAGLLNDQES